MAESSTEKCEQEEAARMLAERTAHELQRKVRMVLVLLLVLLQLLLLMLTRLLVLTSVVRSTS